MCVDPTAQTDQFDFTIPERGILVVDTLNDTEVRVLGSLIEKEITTPDYYPLSLNALMAAYFGESHQ